MNIVPCIWESGPWCLGWLIEKLFFPLIIAFVVYRLALHQIEKTRQANLANLDRKRQIDFADKQLSEFYAPMVGARADIHIHDRFDQRLKRAHHFLFGRHRRVRDRETYGWNDLARFDSKEAKGLEVKPLETLRLSWLMSERIDAYVAMRELFGRKMAYADQGTRDWYDYFASFVEGKKIYRGFFRDGSRSNEVAALAMLNEKELEPFFAHLVERTNELQLEIQGKIVIRAAAPVPPTPLDLEELIREQKEKYPYPPADSGREGKKPKG